MRSLILLATTLLVGVVGCSKPPDDLVTVEGTGTQRRLTAAYSLYTTFQEKKGRSPTGADELKVFGENLPTTQGGPVVLTPEFMASPRDHKEIVLRYDLPLRDAKKTNDKGPVLAHEAVGINGKRMVVYLGNGYIEELSEEQFRELVR